MASEKSTNISAVFKNSSSPRPFFQAYTYAFQKDATISLSAKGLLAMMLSFGPGWKFYMKDLEKRCTNGRESLRSALHELTTLQYVNKTQIRDCHGHFHGWSFIVYDLPHRMTDSPISDKPNDGKPEVGKPVDITYTINNTNNINKNKQQAVDVNLISELKHHGLQENVSLRLISKFGIEKTRFQLTHLKALLQEGTQIKNHAAWFSDALKNNYQPCHTSSLPVADSNCQDCHGSGKIKLRIDDTGAIITRSCSCLQRRN